METKNTLSIGSLVFKITAEKLYIETPTGSETYALRSINGISVKDDVATFNAQVTLIKSSKLQGGLMIGFGILLLVICSVAKFFLIGLVSAIILGAIGFWFMSKLTDPRLQSIVRITMNSGDKAFSFYKDEASASEVADFVATLENTLTAFHKE
jgi:hypothetical protein